MPQKSTSIVNNYEKVKQRLNQLSSNAGQKVTEFQFVCAFNKAQYRWFEQRIKVKERDQSIQEDLQIFQKTECLKPTTTKTGHLQINLPEDYYYYQRVYGKCEKGCEQEIYAYPREEGNVNRLLNDECTKPSFGWQETFFTIGDCKLIFYIDNFTCSEIVLVYYKCPQEVDMSGIEYPDGKKGINVNSELTKGQLEEVLDLTVQILSADTNNPRYTTITNDIVQHGTS